MRSLIQTCLVWILLLAGATLRAQLSPVNLHKIDDAVAQTLKNTAAPSASLAIVKDGKIVYVKAYGSARLEPATPARAEMRYCIGSISKQFLAGAILMLVQDGKLSLDDRVGRYLPDLTQANDISVRQLLSHTSGYQDYAPLDYNTPQFLPPATPAEILKQWAKIPLDFQPGTQWQYSNTNYVAAGRILEIASGMPLGTFLQQRIFGPLGMHSIVDLDDHYLASSDPAGYMRYALGPPRPATHEGAGWYFGAGELAMTAQDLAAWDVAMIENKVLTPASTMEMTRPVRLKNGAPVNYGLGVSVAEDDGRLKISHGGEVSGFTAYNVVWPGQRCAIAVLINMDATRASRLIADKITSSLLAGADPKGAQQLEMARKIFEGLQQGTIDRSLLTSDANYYFTAQALADYSASLKPLGTVKTFEQTDFEPRGGMVSRAFRVELSSGKTVKISTFITPDGKLAQFLVAPQ